MNKRRKVNSDPVLDEMNQMLFLKLERCQNSGHYRGMERTIIY